MCYNIQGQEKEILEVFIFVHLFHLFIHSFFSIQMQSLILSNIGVCASILI